MSDLPKECGECLYSHQEEMYLCCGHEDAPHESGIVPVVSLCPANGRPEWCPLVTEVYNKGE